jgi:hypothetical protein
MSTAVAKRAVTAVKLKPIADVVVQIRGHLYDALTLEGRANKHRVAAGQKLLSLRQRIEAGEEGDVAWWDWFEKQDIGRSRKDCEKLMRIASADDPEAALEDERERVRLAVAKSREKKKQLPAYQEVWVDGDEIKTRNLTAAEVEEVKDSKPTTLCGMPLPIFKNAPDVTVTSNAKPDDDEPAVETCKPTEALDFAKAAAKNAREAAGILRDTEDALVIDDELIRACEAASAAWGKLAARLIKKRASTLPRGGQSEVAVDDYLLGEIPPCLDWRKKSDALFAKLEAELKRKNSGGGLKNGPRGSAATRASAQPKSKG